LNNDKVRGTLNLKTELSELRSKCRLSGSMETKVSLELLMISTTVLQSFSLMFSIISMNSWNSDLDRRDKRSERFLK